VPLCSVPACSRCPALTWRAKAKGPPSPTLGGENHRQTASVSNQQRLGQILSEEHGSPGLSCTWPIWWNCRPGGGPCAEIQLAQIVLHLSDGVRSMLSSQGPGAARPVYCSRPTWGDKSAEPSKGNTMIVTATCHRTRCNPGPCVLAGSNSSCRPAVRLECLDEPLKCESIQSHPRISYDQTHSADP